MQHNLHWSYYKRQVTGACDNGVNFLYTLFLNMIQNTYYHQRHGFLYILSGTEGLKREIHSLLTYTWAKPISTVRLPKG